MVGSLPAFHISKPVKHEAFLFFVHGLVLFAIQSQPASPNCIIDIGNSTFFNVTNCGSVNWGGFISSSSCCGGAFDRYLYALAKRANLTKAIYLNATQQHNCLTSIGGLEKEDIFSGCGVEDLTSGAGGCSDFTVVDVANKIGDRFWNLLIDCETLGSDERPDQSCEACLRRWEETGGSFDDKHNSTGREADVCRFAVLVSMVSNRIDDDKWVQAVFQCLGNQSLSTDEKGDTLTGKKIQRNTGLLVLITGLVGIAVMVAVAACILFRSRNAKNSPSIGKKESKYSISEDSTGSLKISMKEIYSATNNFDPTNFIGQGIAGKVYKGQLSNGRHVAVKHIISDGQAETFLREVRSLSHVRHPNLVALIGYCENDDESFLVYELCHRGNLSEWLYGKDKVLSWIQRLEIAIDCARGLWFLHTYPEGCIVHRDIKPTNILLDDHFRAKLSDFGQSKVMDIGQSYVSSEVRGTFGYVDPEYRKNRRVNASGDVYSFGIVLLQLLSGQKVFNMNTNRPLPLNKKARFLTKGSDMAEFADPKLGGDYSLEAFDLVLKLALTCTGLKQERPQMEQVALTLETALQISTQSGLKGMEDK